VSSPEAQHLIVVLRTAMRVLGFSMREVERRMGLSSSYLSRLLSGRVELKVDHVVEIARVLELDPREIFVIAFSGRPGHASEAAAKTRAALGHLVARPAPVAGPPAAADATAAEAAPATPTPQSASSDPMEQRVDRILQQFFELSRGESP
jgi:transcriptional regulator with XRE-family HTH domain